MTVILGRGRDVYHGNGKINWNYERDTNHVTWAMTKVTQGLGFTDDMFPANKAGIAAAALTGGGYHYADPGQDPDAQAKRFVSLYRPTAGKNFVCLDLEKAPAAMTQGQVAAWRRAYSAGIRRYAPGVFYVIYEGGYAHNGSGAGIANECDAWMYPEYPGLRSFPSTFTVHVASPNTTGKTLPEIWQCSDNIGGLDGSVSIISAAQLAGPAGITSGALTLSSAEFDQLEALIKTIPALTLGQPIPSLRPESLGKPIALRDYIAAIDLDARHPPADIAAAVVAAIVAEIPAATGALTADQVETAVVAGLTKVLTIGTNGAAS